MKVPYISTAVLLTLTACGGYEQNEASYNADNAAYAEGDGNYAAGSGSNYASAGSGWPEGSRIVVEEGVTYRVEPGGVRVALGPDDSRIVVENGVRFRVDPGGTRVRLDPSGAAIAADTDEVKTTVRSDGSVTVNQP